MNTRSKGPREGSSKKISREDVEEAAGGALKDATEQQPSELESSSARLSPTTLPTMDLHVEARFNAIEKSMERFEVLLLNQLGAKTKEHESEARSTPDSPKVEEPAQFSIKREAQQNLGTLGRPEHEKVGVPEQGDRVETERYELNKETATFQGPAHSPPRHPDLDGQPQQRTYEPTGASTFSHLHSPGTLGFILGKENLFKGQLANVSDLYTVIRHLDDFDIHCQKFNDRTQAFSTTLTNAAIIDLDLEKVKIDTIPLVEWKIKLSSHMRELRPQLQDVMDCLAQVPCEGLTTTSDVTKFHTRNTAAVQRYLKQIEKVRAEAEILTGINAQHAKAERATVEHGPSTVMEVIHNKLAEKIPEFIPILTEGIRFRALTSWNQLYGMLLQNIADTRTAFLCNRRLFHVYEEMSQNRQKNAAKHAREQQYANARANHLRDKLPDKAPDKDKDRQQWNRSAVHKKLYPVPLSMNALASSIDGLAGNTNQNGEPETSTDEESFHTAAQEEPDSEQFDQVDEMIAAMGRENTQTACFHHLQGNCSKGDDCSFSHNESECVATIRAITKVGVGRYAALRNVTPQITSMVQEETAGRALRIRVQVNDQDAIALVDTGNELPTCVSESFTVAHNLITYPIKPTMVDLAGTGVKKEMTRGTNVFIKYRTPITQETRIFKTRAIVFPTARDDVIVGMRDIIDNLVPLVCELLLAAKHGITKKDVMLKALSGIAGDIYSISHLTNDENIEEVPIQIVDEASAIQQEVEAEDANDQEGQDSNDDDEASPLLLDEEQQPLNLDLPDTPYTYAIRRALVDQDEDQCPELIPVHTRDLTSKPVPRADLDAFRATMSRQDSEDRPLLEAPQRKDMSNNDNVPQRFFEDTVLLNPIEDDVEDDKMPTLVPIQAWRRLGQPKAAGAGTEGEPPRKIRKPINSPPAKTNMPADERATSEPVHGQIYSSPFTYERAPEETESPEADLFGHAAAEVLDSAYNTDEAYQRRLQEYRENIEAQVGDEMGELRDEWIQWLATPGGDAEQCFVHKYWHGLSIKPVSIPFLDSLPEAIRQPPRPVRRDLEKEVTEHIRALAMQGWLLYATTGSYGSPTSYLRKPSGKLRMVTDLRKVNKHIRPSTVPQPHVLSTLQRLQGFTIFTDMDWVTAYHQIPLDELSQERLAMTTPIGLYRPRFLPEGVSVGSGIMMAVVYATFQDFEEWLIAIHDNILIAAHNPRDMMDKLKRVFKRCAEVGVQLNVKKCHFGVSSLEFFGYVVQPGSYRIDDSRIQDILQIPFPKTKKQVQRYIGMCVFCSPFIPFFVEKFTLLYDMIKDGFSFEEKTWTTDYRAAFLESKQSMQKAATIHYPDRELEWILRTDASNVAVGAVLLQLMPVDTLTSTQRAQAEKENLVREDGTVACPLAFISKKLSDPATRWTTTEQELFAIIHAFVKLNHMLAGKTVIVETDHRNIVALAESSLATSDRCRRWTEFLTSQQYVIRHIAGVKNITADYLSRFHETIPAHIAGDGIAVILTMLQADQDEHRGQHRSTSYLHSIMYAEHTDTDEEEMPSLCAIGTIPAPTTYDEAIREVHYSKLGHHGAKATWKEVKKRFPNADIPFIAVQKIVQDCEVCAKIRDVPGDPQAMIRALPTYHARAMTNVDILTLTTDKHGFRYCIVFVNTFTKYTLIFPTKTKEARETAMAMLNYAATVGITETFISDNGPEFAAEVTQELTKILGAAWTFTLAYRPQANGIVERQNGEILRCLRVLLSYQDTWNAWSEPAVIALVQLHLNTRIHGTTGYAPVELMFGTMARQYQPSPNALRQAENPDLYGFNQALERIHAATRENILASQLPRLRNQPAVRTTFSPGDLVLRNPRKHTGAVTMRGNKLEPTNLGPYVVIEQERTGEDISNSVHVYEINDAAKEHVFHASTLKIFPGTLEEGKEAAKQDKLEFSITRFITLQGNPRKRDELEAIAELEDGSQLTLPYSEARFTEAFDDYCEKLVIGKQLSLTNEEITEFTKENSPMDGQTLTQYIQSLPEDQHIQVKDRVYITLYWWANTSWSIHDDPNLLPPEVRNREPLLLAIVKKFTRTKIDIEIPSLAKITTKTTKPYIIALSWPNFLLFTTREQNIRDLSIIMTHELLEKCDLQETLQRAAGL